ncbi:hypothetical protein D3C81_2303890 [compost metagenome]
MEVVGYEAGEIRLNPLYRFEESNEDKDAGKSVQGSLKKVGSLQNTEKLKNAGIEIR